MSDGGLETDLIFHQGLELTEFAAFPLLKRESTARVLLDYYAEYVAIAVRAGAGLVLETARLGYDSARRAGQPLPVHRVLETAPGMIDGKLLLTSSR